MKASDTEIRKKGAASGLLLGLILMVLSIFSFYFVTGIASSFWMVTMGPVIFSVVIPLIVAGVFSSDLRKKIGGFWTFRQAVTGIFVMLVVSYAITYIGANLIFGKLVEPQMVEKTQAAVKNATTQYMEKQGVDQQKIDDTNDKMQKQFDTQSSTSPIKMITSFAISLIFIFVLALIYAAIFKKDPPLYDTVLNEDAAADPTV